MIKLGSLLIALSALNANGGQASSEQQEAALQGDVVTVDACTVPAKDLCFGGLDCADECGPPFCPGPMMCGGDPPLYVCCPRGTSLDYDPDRGVFICTGVIMECPEG
jgi:hypothetical protein